MKEQYQKVLRNKNYFKLFLADSISRFGDSLDAIVMTLLVYTLTQSASWSALIFAVNRLPTIFIQPLAGTYIEKKNKQRMMIISDFIRALFVGIIATLLMFNCINKWHVLIFTFLISLVEAFRQPASASIIPQILQQEELEIGLSLSSGISKAIELIGTGLAGFLIVYLGQHTVVYIDMMTFLFSAILIASLSLREKVIYHEEQSFFGEFKEGLILISQYSQMKILVILAVYLNAVITPFHALQAPLVEDVLHSSSIMLSMMSTSLTLGLIGGSLLYPKIKEKTKINTMMTLATFMISINYVGICIVGYTIYSQWLLYCIVFILFVVTGFSIGCINMFANTQLFILIPEDYLSRMTSLLTSLCACMMPVVSLVISLLATYVSISILFMGIGLLNGVIFIAFLKEKCHVFDETCTDTCCH